MDYRIIPVTKFHQNCSLIWCIQTRLASIIDPGGNAEQIKQIISSAKLSLVYILLTHGHLDHVGAATELARYYAVPIIGPGKEDEFWLQNLSMQRWILGLDNCQAQSLVPNSWLNEGDIINIGNITLHVFHCPGHTPGHIVFFDKKSRFLISGDLIFKDSIGRSDFPRSNHNVLVDSIKKKLFPLGDDVKFIPGHGPISTLGYERLYNPFVRYD